MKKILYLSVCILLAIGCGQKTDKSERPGSKQSNSHKELSFENLLKNYAEIPFDTLKVFSSYKLDDTQYRFKGVPLDTADVALLPKNLLDEYPSENDYFACYRFALDDNTVGLVTRTPSIYEPSSVRLLIYDRKTNRITNQLELAEVFGDAGDTAEKTAWLFKDGDAYNAFIWVTESHDNSVDDIDNKTVESWNRYFLVNFFKSQIDTVKTDEKELLSKFGHLIKKEVGE